MTTATTLHLLLDGRPAFIRPEASILPHLGTHWLLAASSESARCAYSLGATGNWTLRGEVCALCTLGA